MDENNKINSEKDTTPDEKKPAPEEKAAVLNETENDNDKEDLNPLVKDGPHAEKIDEIAQQEEKDEKEPEEKVAVLNDTENDNDKEEKIEEIVEKEEDEKKPEEKVAEMNEVVAEEKEKSSSAPIANDDDDDLKCVFEKIEKAKPDPIRVTIPQSYIKEEIARQLAPIKEHTRMLGEKFNQIIQLVFHPIQLPLAAQGQAVAQAGALIQADQPILPPVVADVAQHSEENPDMEDEVVTDEEDGSGEEEIEDCLNERVGVIENSGSGKKSAEHDEDGDADKEVEEQDNADELDEEPAAKKARNE